MAHLTRKPRLYSPQKFKLPRPKLKKRTDNFELRTLSESDGRYHCVKLLRRQMTQLCRDCNADTVQKEMLAARVVYLNGYLESQETDSLEGKDIDWSNYLAATRTLADLCNKLGLDRAEQSAQRLADYIEQNGKTGRHRNGKLKK